MSQEQPRKDQSPIKYGDVFDVSGKLASKPIAPGDASTLQSAENIVLGETKKGGPASVMQSSAAVNEKLGVVGHHEMTDVAREEGVTVTEAVVGGRHVIAERVAGQVVGGYVEGTGVADTTGLMSTGAITVGEALEATAHAAGGRPVEQSDAAAIQAAEARAAGFNPAGGIGTQAQSAATRNEQLVFEENKTMIGEVLADATMRLPGDKAVTRGDAEGVKEAEVRNKLDMSTNPGGVAAAMAMAARLNEQT